MNDSKEGKKSATAIFFGLVLMLLVVFVAGARFGRNAGSIQTTAVVDEEKGEPAVAEEETKDEAKLPDKERENEAAVKIPDVDKEQMDQYRSIKSDIGKSVEEKISGSQVSSVPIRDEKETVKDNKPDEKPVEQVQAPQKKKEVPANEPDQKRKKYTVQVRSTSDPEEAKKVMEELKALGYAAFIRTADRSERGLLHRVRIGHFDDKEEAINICNKIIDQGKFKDAYVRADD